MSATNIEIVFEGAGVESGTINARALGESLIGCSEVFTRATQVFHLYGDSAIRKAFGQLTSPLREETIDRIAVKQDGSEQAAFEKSDIESFQSQPLELEADDAPAEGERDTVLIVSKLSFKE